MGMNADMKDYRILLLLVCLLLSLSPAWPAGLGAEPKTAAYQQEGTLGPLSAIAEFHNAEEKAILDVVPSLSELGAGWTTNVVAYLLDPRSHPSEIDYHGDTESSPQLSAQREVMRTNGRTGCGLVLYGHGNLIMNSGLYRVYIQRWDNRRSLHNCWVDWKMNPNRIVRDTPPIGEDCFWVYEWWRQTLVRQHLVFRLGLFHVVVEAGAESDFAPMVRLGQVLDAKIRGRSIPEPPYPSKVRIAGLP
jgi:hypothetical protein